MQWNSLLTFLSSLQVISTEVDMVDMLQAPLDAYVQYYWQPAGTTLTGNLISMYGLKITYAVYYPAMASGTRASQRVSQTRSHKTSRARDHCPACRTSLIATRFWVVMICPIIKCLTVLEFSFILFDLNLFITIFNFILNYVPIVTFWILTYHKIWILLIIFCFIWSYWIIYFLTCLEVFWSVVS